jgi:methylenetetrahydrofolate dehydrogenase (NADP+)/methenyltetrahydrofolate cyclohydrolase
LQAHGVRVPGTRTTVVGNGRLVGQPIAEWFREQGAEVFVVDIDTPKPELITALADIVVAGVGKAGLIRGDWIKEGATVIDFGYEKGKGDVDIDSVQKKAGLLTPVPGGMGPLVIAAVLENLLTLSTS